MLLHWGKVPTASVVKGLIPGILAPHLPRASCPQNPEPPGPWSQTFGRDTGTRDTGKGTRHSLGALLNPSPPRSQLSCQGKGKSRHGWHLLRGPRIHSHGGPRSFPSSLDLRTQRGGAHLISENDTAPSCLSRAQPAQHAEVRLLKRIQSWELGSELPYEVTCFQSWSPCCNCAKQLARFLEENKHVTLSIFASRLHTMEDYEEGLRILRSAGAHIAIMTSQDFEHCWDTSVDNHGNPFQPWNTLVSQSQKLSEKLKVILKRAEDGLQCR
ncbi:single-stranded DNA cytosine deaminase-like isoform X3 [Suricata suricatta]|uniref:single-stranded DNA cytosine deaminase-like isoform X3 n=1 Tax=Suricata suricatta TaxID=37032 RepID=UPI0011558299|nr:single-stranded DNA cytosine deaminase-like isoform X3 [Suricata suricatta]